ncbi:MAG: Na/Pi symporter [Ornithinimicrobium sp.]
MTHILRSVTLPFIMILLVVGFWMSGEFREVAAGVAIFLFGMLMLEQGFELFSGGFLERILERATKSTPRAIAFGFTTTSVMQSSSLVSVITISFLSAGLLSLVAGVGIIFGANIGTTTGAWLVAGFGLKVDIAAFAMPMLALSIVLVFQKSKYVRGGGYVLAGMGFLFLGIHHMKVGFESFDIDLSSFAMTGVAGLLVYTLIGAAATVIMQSSHATMVLVITALAANQVTYENALALSIGANVGTTVTAIIGAATANYQGRRLALAHVIFNVGTGAVALIFIVPLAATVDWISGLIGIAPDDYTLKLAVFHTLFNLLGVVLMLPLFHRLIVFLERTIPSTEPGISQPRYLNDAVGAFPETIEAALTAEVGHLHDNAIELIAHGLSLHRSSLYESHDLETTVRAETEPFDFDIDHAYEQRVKVLYAAILEFVNNRNAHELPVETVQRMYALRESAEHMVGAVKEVKHMRENTVAFTATEQGDISALYDGLRTEIAEILVALHELKETPVADRSVLWLEDERTRIKSDKTQTGGVVEGLMREEALTATASTSFMNDANYAYRAMKELVDAARLYYGEREGPLAEVERLLEPDEDLEFSNTHSRGRSGES